MFAIFKLFSLHLESGWGNWGTEGSHWGRDLQKNFARKSRNRFCHLEQQQKINQLLSVFLKTIIVQSHICVQCLQMVNFIENLLKDKLWLCYFISVFVETRNRRSVVDVTRQFDEISLQIPKCELIFYLQNDNVQLYIFSYLNILCSMLCGFCCFRQIESWDFENWIEKWKNQLTIKSPDVIGNENRKSRKS